MTNSEWADEHFYLSPESSSAPGKWKTLPFQREPMNMIGAPGVSRITVKKSSRVGATKSFVDIPLARSMHIEPRSSLVVLPTEQSAEAFSKDEIAPMLRDCPALEDLLKDRTRMSESTLLKKVMPGMTLHIGGANSSRVFRQITVARAYLDEVSAYPPSAGGEGDQVKLAWQRMGDAWDALLVELSTPKIKGTCRITESFALSDQRRFLMPCPHCDHGQFYKFGGKDHDYGLKWEDGEPSTAIYLCEHCHCPIEQRSKRWMLDEGHYEAQNPAGQWPGFHIWAAMSPLPNGDWGAIAREFLESKSNPELLQVFVNTYLGEEFEEVGDAPAEGKLMLRRHRYPLRDTGQVHADGEPERENMVPSQVAVLTSFTDVQNNRLETQVMGWGAGEEAWTIEYHVLYGDPTAEPLWAELWELLSRQRYLERGGVDYIRSSAIDSGYAATSVYKFVAPRPIYMTPDGRNSYTWATKGRAGTGQVWPKKPGQSQLKNVPVYTVMVDDAKDIMSARLQNIEEPGPGYVHFPLDFGESYFRQLTAEQAFTRRDKKGFAHKVWELKKGRQRNEVWDTLVGNYAALCALYSIGFDLQGECEELARRTPWEPPAVQGEPAPPVAPPAPEVVAQAQQNGQWLRGGRRGKWLR